MTPGCYRITVRGKLSERFSSVFAGLAPEAGNGQTALVGRIADQAELFGVLDRVRAFGLDLVSVEEVPE